MPRSGDDRKFHFQYQNKETQPLTLLPWITSIFIMFYSIVKKNTKKTTSWQKHKVYFEEKDKNHIKYV